MSNSKRSMALGWIRIAGYHADDKAMVRLYVENRISYQVAIAEFRRGAEMKRAGVPCFCSQCAK